MREAQKLLSQAISPIDKAKDCWTVSQKFRNDILTFFKPQKHRFLEIGCHRGLTAKCIAHHFIQYHGVDINPESLRFARIVNMFNFNVGFQRFDLYGDNWHNIGFTADIVFIDALHEYEYIKQDIDNCLMHFQDAYIIFDDYGAWESVFRAVNEAIADKKITVLQEIGMKQGQQLWLEKHDNIHAWTQFGPEGLICRPA